MVAPPQVIYVFLLFPSSVRPLARNMGCCTAIALYERRVNRIACTLYVHKRDKTST